MDAENLINPHLREMQPYTPIVPFEVLSARLGIAPDKLIKLDANENLYGASPRALEAMTSAAHHIYPDPDQTELRQAISAHIGVPMEHILCGAGGDEVLDLIGRAFTSPGDAIIDCPPTFGMYRWLADVLNARYVSVPRRADFSLDAGAIQHTISQTPNAKLLFAANPNNPDGSVTHEATLRRLLALPIVVVLDEAYIDFSAQPSRAAWVREYDNLIVVRTFSKLLGLAGARVGYGVFPLSVIKHLWKVKQPYTPNVAGGAMAVAALRDAEYLREQVRLIVAERQRMSEMLDELDWLRVMPSETNFVLCQIDPTRIKDRGDGAPLGLQIKRLLERRGILVRFFDKPALRDCIRISVGKPEHTDALIAALREMTD